MRFIDGVFWKHVAKWHVGWSGEFDDVTNRRFDPAAVEAGDVVFVKTDCLDRFVATSLPEVRARFTLVTANSDLTPSWAATEAITRHPLVARWCAMHVVENHKLVAIPIGVSDHFAQTAAERVADGASNPPRKRRAWLPPTNSAVHPLRAELGLVCHPVLDVSVDAMSNDEYYQRMTEYEYVISPVGCGVDCFRTYEAMLARAVPIFVTDGPAPAVYNKYPVVVVHGVEGLRRFLDDLPPPPAVDWDAVRASLESARAVDAWIRSPTEQRQFANAMPAIPEAILSTL